MLEPGRALLNYGPVCLSLEAYRLGEPYALAARAGALRAAGALEELVPHLDTARLACGHPDCRLNNDQPEVLRLMIQAVKALGQPDFTPMAAVAGVFSHLACRAARDAGADRVIVNNGGDIALWDETGQGFRVGLVDDLAIGRASHLLIHSGQALGVATSGLGGRSLTKGVASAVTCWADTCPPADAAATCIANATGMDHPLVQTALAEDMDPLTDLKGHQVVVSVGKLPGEFVDKALNSGLGMARRLIETGLIKGCALFVQGKMKTLPAEAAIHPLSEGGPFAPRNIPERGSAPDIGEEDHGTKI